MLRLEILCAIGVCSSGIVLTLLWHARRAWLSDSRPRPLGEVPIDGVSAASPSALIATMTARTARIRVPLPLPPSAPEPAPRENTPRRARPTGPGFASISSVLDDLSCEASLSSVASATSVISTTDRRGGHALPTFSDLCDPGEDGGPETMIWDGDDARDTLVDERNSDTWDDPDDGLATAWWTPDPVR